MTTFQRFQPVGCSSDRSAPTVAWGWAPQGNTAAGGALGDGTSTHAPDYEGAIASWESSRRVPKVFSRAEADMRQLLNIPAEFSIARSSDSDPVEEPVTPRRSDASRFTTIDHFDGDALARDPLAGD